MSKKNEFVIANDNLVAYRGKASEVVIPDGVTVICENAFLDCKCIKQVVMPDSVKEIRWGAFSKCKNLESVRISPNVEQIGPYAFYECRKLQSVNIPEGVKIIGSYAFEGCSSIESVTFPNTVTAIRIGAFHDCKKLKTANLPAGITMINPEVFRGCRRLESVIIPDSVTEIGQKAFKGCSSLASVIIPRNVTNIEAQAFEKCGSLTSVSIADNVTKIGASVFYDCEQYINFQISSESVFSLLWKVLTESQRMRMMEMAIRERTESPAIQRKIKANRRGLLKFAIDKESAELAEAVLSSHKKVPLEELNQYIEETELLPSLRAVFLNYKAQVYPLKKQEQMINDEFEKEIGLKSRTISDWKKLFTLEKTAEGYVIKGYRGDRKDIVIPETIGNHNVNKIGDFAFSPNAKGLYGDKSRYRICIETIEIPACILEIGDNAFYGCNRLTIYTPAGSYAETYAKKNGLKYKTRI